MAQAFEGGKSPDFYISENWLKLYQSICRRGRSRGEGYPLFDKYTNLYTLCAAIGHSIDKEETIEKPYSPFTLEQIDEKTEWPVLQAIAWKRSGQELTVFIDAKKAIDICGRCAEAGIRHLVDEYLEDYMDEEGKLLRPGNIDLEIGLSHKIEDLRQNALFA